MSPPPCHLSGSGRPPLEVAQIFRDFGEAFRATHVLSIEQARTMRAIEKCRTAGLGGHVDVCDQCGFERPAYNSCRDRHCPKCQGLSQAAWVDRQMKRILATCYFHVVFTLPAELRGLAQHNRAVIFDLLFSAASQTLLELGRDPKHLGALLGFTAVLHTWKRDLQFHPHAHCIVTGGGLRDDGTWVSRHGDRYLFPRAVLGALFRGKFMAGLVRARNKDALRFLGSCATLADDNVFNALRDKLYRKDWIVYAKKPFRGAEQVYRYLGRYTHRVGISNSRLRSIDENGVSFSTKDGSTVTVSPDEFSRRFLLHVLPKGFVKIRHYGLFAAPNLQTKLVLAKDDIARQRQVGQSIPVVADEKTWQKRFEELTGVDLSRCPRCGTGTMVRRPLPTTPARPPPLLELAS